MIVSHSQMLVGLVVYLCYMVHNVVMEPCGYQGRLVWTNISVSFSKHWIYKPGASRIGREECWGRLVSVYLCCVTDE